MITCAYLVLILSIARVCYTQEACRTANGDTGFCMLLERCEPIFAIHAKTKKTPEDLLFLRQSNCGLFMNTQPKVCCPPQEQWLEFSTEPPSTHPTHIKTTTTEGAFNADTTPPYVYKPLPWSDERCKPTIQPPQPEDFCCGIEVASTDRIIGGNVAAPDQFPWLALLEYDTIGHKTGCGGSLISSRYVLTAAHCLGRTIWGAPVKVRLGEYNTSSFPTDTFITDGGGIEYVTVVVIDIEKEMQHYLYKKNGDDRQHDIGLVKLAQNAPYTAFIRPICLPTRDVTVHPEENLRFFSAGWGSDGTHYSDVKKFISLPHVPLHKCRKSYTLPRESVNLTEKHICAGSLKDQDTCQGDSGGPLIYENGDIYVLAGVVSFGSYVCGTEGKPGVYTNVYEYRNWILANTI